MSRRRRKPQPRRNRATTAIPARPVGGKPSSFVPKSPDGKIFAGNIRALNYHPPIDLPKDVEQCRADRHAIYEELDAALNCQPFPWAFAGDDPIRGLEGAFRVSSIVKENPAEHFKRSWLHAARRATNEGFMFEAAPASVLLPHDPDLPEPCAYITCAHAACRAHARDGISIFMKGDEALEGLKASGLMPELDPVEACIHRRQLILRSLLSDLCGDGRFVVTGYGKTPKDLTLCIINDGSEVELSCEHIDCDVDGRGSLSMMWESSMADIKV